MTAAAVVFNGPHSFQRVSMTIGTLDFGMRAGQRKFGLRVVVENPELPVNRVVTGVALRVKIAFMWIVFFVAVDTFC